jgi:hypothetical protein
MPFSAVGDRISSEHDEGRTSVGNDQPCMGLGTPASANAQPRKRGGTFLEVSFIALTRVRGMPGFAPTQV